MNRKALIVGINDYAPSGAGGPDLQGCVSDARDMANTLSSMGFVPASPANMRILTDARATRANIISGLQWLVKGAKKGDVLVFHYSGHGSQVVDTHGDELDKKDETICPQDFASAGMIKDDDLRGIFGNLAAGVNLDVILDSCHSGTATRNPVTIRYVEPPLDWGFFLDANPTLPRRGILKKGAGEKEAVIAPGLNHVLWAGCRDYETSAELPIGGTPRGAFTYAFCKCLRGAGATVTRSKLDALVSTYLNQQLHVGQHPQLEGTKASLAEKAFT